MIQIQPPTPLPQTKSPVIFLGGSIDMGKASDWRGAITREFDGSDVVFLNPWGSNFDPRTPQEAENEAFAAQVNWELTALESSDIIVFYFEPTGKAPVSMLELGLYARTSKVVIVCCPEGYWRKGNVDMVCTRYDVTQVDTIPDIVETIKHWVSIMTAKAQIPDVP